MKELNGRTDTRGNGAGHTETPTHLTDLARRRELAASRRYRAIADHMAKASNILEQVADLLGAEDHS